MEWSLDRARWAAERQLGTLGARWRHAQSVGWKGEVLVKTYGQPVQVGCAAWLHDVGYSPLLSHSGFHPLDGARFLKQNGAPAQLVSLVAYHSGARFEAAERGLSEQLAEFSEPAESDLDLLTLVDMSTSPDGAPVAVTDRLMEILSRYAPDDPVHRAVSRSWGEMVESCARAKRALGLADERHFPAL